MEIQISRQAENSKRTYKVHYCGVGMRWDMVVWHFYEAF